MVFFTLFNQFKCFGVTLFIEISNFWHYNLLKFVV